MNKYYYADNDIQYGPFTIDELKTKHIKKTTLIWTEGMEDWTLADEIEELKNIIISQPPPLPKKQTNSNNQTNQNSSTVNKIDNIYKKESEATIVGVILLFAPIIIKIIGDENINSIESYNQAKAATTIGAIIVRIIVTIWVIDIAKMQNRNTTNWGLFSFFLPSIALIIIGQLNKLKLKIELDSNLQPNQQLSILLEKANELYNYKRFAECIEIINKAIEFDNYNFELIKLRGISNYNLKNYTNAKSDFEFLIIEDMFHSDANYYLGNIALIDKNKELAISYWLKSNELNNENAKIKLDQFYTYNGKYLLKNSQIMKKLNINYNNDNIYIELGNYKGGLHEIDQKEKPDTLKTSIIGYKLGLEIKLNKILNKYSLAISYFEINDIIYKTENNLLEIHLIDDKILSFNYDSRKDYKNGLRSICLTFKNLTGLTPDAIYIKK
jgi:hypothetical protein